MKETRSLRARGITLIALVITIIVLLILAGISIAMLTGENGILTKANEAKQKTENSSLLEELRLQVFEKETSQEANEMDMEIYLKQKGILKNEENEVDLSKMSTEYSLGKGNFTDGDVYYIKDGSLYYKAKDGSETNIGKVFAVEVALTKDIYKYKDSEKTQLAGVLDEYKRLIQTSPKVSLIQNKVIKVASLNSSDIKLAKDQGKGSTEGKNGRAYDIVDGDKIVTSLELPDTVKTIEYGSFANAVSIEKVKIQQGCTKIGDIAFYNCQSLKSIEIPSTVTSIEGFVFKNCNKDLKIIIHNTEENLPFDSFWGVDRSQIEYVGM